MLNSSYNVFFLENVDVNFPYVNTLNSVKKRVKDAERKMQKEKNVFLTTSWKNLLLLTFLGPITNDFQILAKFNPPMSEEKQSSEWFF